MDIRKEVQEINEIVFDDDIDMLGNAVIITKEIVEVGDDDVEHHVIVLVTDDGSSVPVRVSAVPYLIKALNKAKELGWWKDHQISRGKIE